MANVRTGRKMKGAPLRWQKRLQRFLFKTGAVVAGVAVTLVVTVNLAVGFFGSAPVNLFSPFYMEEKLHALRRYASHRVGCVFRSLHEDIPAVVRAVALERRLDPLLLAALVETESSNRAHRISFTGAMGPAQLMPGTAALLHVEDPFDPQQGIDGGARYLQQLLTRFHGRVDLALAAYNAGPGNVVGGKVPSSPDVELYVSRVTARWNALKAAR